MSAHYEWVEGLSVSASRQQADPRVATLTINLDDEHEPGISTFAKRRAPLHRRATPVRTERDLADTVDGTHPSPHRCDCKAISRTNNFYEIYPAAAARGYAWNVALLLRKMVAGDARTYRPPTAGLMLPLPDLAPPLW